MSIISKAWFKLTLVYVFFGSLSMGLLESVTDHAKSFEFITYIFLVMLLAWAGVYSLSAAVYLIARNWFIPQVWVPVKNSTLYRKIYHWFTTDGWF